MDPTYTMLLKLRELSKDCIFKHHLSTARFYADKACTMSKYEHSDVYILAKIYFLNKEYHRCIHLLQKYSLIPHANQMGVNDISFQNDLSKMAEKSSFNNNNNNININVSSIKINKECQLKYLLLGMRSYLECGEHESCISIINDNDDIALEIIQPPIILTKSSHSSASANEINISSLLCMIRGKSFEKMEIQSRALFWFKKSLIFDVRNIESFECIINRRLSTPQALNVFLSRELKPKYNHKSLEWILFYYKCKISCIASTFEDITDIKRELVQYPQFQQGTNDLNIILSSSLLNINLYRESYKLSSLILVDEPYNTSLSLLTSHIISLVELGLQSELYKLSHDLICEYPSYAISWFSVGCYYYMTKRYEISRRFLNKSTSISSYYYSSWIVLGHTFSEQDADDQAMTAYRAANRLFPSSHKPLLYIGMGYLNMNNYVYAEKFFKEAYKLYNRDPMIYNELGVVYYNIKKYSKAADYFKTTIKYISCDCYNQFESTFFNLGHCYRKLGEYDNAQLCYNKSLNISPRDPMILSAIAFTFQLQNKLDKSIEYYHKVLSLQPHDTFANEMLHRALNNVSNTLLLND